MDGNRRYAKKQNLPIAEGYSKGYDKMVELIYLCRTLDIVEFTIYAFSIGNFKRNKEEVDSLMNLARQKFKDLLEDKHNMFRPAFRKCAISAIASFCHPPRDEITHAIKDIIQGVKDNDILLEDINEDLITNCLYTYKSPNPDILIRTSGEIRLSDFLLWQISNTCIYFIKVLWPDISSWNLLSVIFYYQRYYSSLQKNRDNFLEPIIRNTRVSTYIDKLHNKRDMEIEKIYQSAIQSQK
ncbi:Dehydrodolichyl diphosphate synthase [Acromyrmex echinatior]|uniref:ditrans,polycis-polyprenyl diphosphate synthase [(2E,6E)-farnesyldiphosphate specific] n=1 Tax=Acromyrmex echinatior TaxID=103372 RepID=F4X7S2_ACREC|nr:Dehydrodolichyl diphosphate synthase [Acromyrmex echinatior]